MVAKGSFLLDPGGLIGPISAGVGAGRKGEAVARGGDAFDGKKDCRLVDDFFVGKALGVLGADGQRIVTVLTFTRAFSVSAGTSDGSSAIIVARGSCSLRGCGGMNRLAFWILEASSLVL